ncbi:MAG: homoserine dehydrogenase [Spirochaetales bacterium]|nr:homoserine dehydrogenase [Spirochaetales bacterium]
MGADKSFGIAVVGCGTVGGSTAQILTRDREMLKKRSGIDLNLKYIVDINFTTAQELGLAPSLFQKDLEVALADPEVKCIVELVGGTTLAKTITEKALNAGKHVITANKALLAHHGNELWALARAKDVSIAFEASCAGGIPIVRALYDGLLSNRIDAIYGIVNGTCNYILTEMIQKGQTYAVALADAQKIGLAEADPTLDVTGGDSAHKLTIMAGLAYGKQIDFDSIPTEGIDTLELMDVSYGQELGYVVKLLAVAQRKENGLSLRVRPAFISEEHPLAWISGPFNAVSVYGHAVGHTMYYGRGAGGSPTGSAVVSDILSVALGIFPIQFKSLGIWPDQCEKAVQLPVEEIKSRYYIRTMIQDSPGMFAKLATVLSESGISISSALQKELPEDHKDTGGVPVVVTTHATTEGLVMKALENIDAMAGVTQKSICINIIDEHSEKI